MPKGQRNTITQCVYDPSCIRPITSRGMCANHYQRWYHHDEGWRETAVYSDHNESLQHKLERHTKVDPETGCWEKIGCVTPAGYSLIWWQGKFQHMSRLQYELHVCAIPEGFDVAHLCKNPGCSNHAHMEHVPHRVACLRGDGHPAQLHLLSIGCLCPEVTAGICPIHGQLHWRPDWRERLADLGLVAA